MIFMYLKKNIKSRFCLQKCMLCLFSKYSSSNATFKCKLSFLQNLNVLLHTFVCNMYIYPFSLHQKNNTIPEFSVTLFRHYLPSFDKTMRILWMQMFKAAVGLFIIMLWSFGEDFQKHRSKISLIFKMWQYCGLFVFFKEWYWKGRHKGAL